MNFLTSAPPQSIDTVTIVVTEVIGDTICIASEDGVKVCEAIAAALRDGKKAIVSFKNGEDITSAFLADAIGHLYAMFPEEQVESSLSFVDMEPDDALYLESTINSVKDSIKDPEGWKAAILEAYGDYYFDK